MRAGFLLLIPESRITCKKFKETPAYAAVNYKDELNAAKLISFVKKIFELPVMNGMFGNTTALDS